MSYKNVIVNINLEIKTPYTTDEEAVEYAGNYELPHGYVAGSFDVVKTIEEEENPNYYCPKCGREITEQPSNNDYFGACSECDEDFYFFEVDNIPNNK